jgi:recombination protein RecT
MADKNTQVAEAKKQQLTASERFTNKVLAEFGSSVGAVALTEFQKRLAQNYFISLDASLKTAEANRLKKSEKYRDPVPVAWDNIDMDSLSRNVVSYARMGLDPAQKNHINMIPYKNNTTKKYGIGFIEGYRGIELKAKKYGLDVPDAVIVELVYTKDKFKAITRSINQSFTSYEFEIVDAFDRGEIKGGFYYHVYSKTPEKNKLVVLTLKDIEKRKPPYASPEFWGGEKDVWEKNEETGRSKKVGTEHVEGWFDKMCYKTVYRAAYNDITIDSQKIDDDYLRVKQLEQEFNEVEVEEEIAENANKEMIDITEGSYTVSDVEDEGSKAEEVKDEKPTENSPKQEQKGQKPQKEPKNLVDMAEEGPIKGKSLGEQFEEGPGY